MPSAWTNCEPPTAGGEQRPQRCARPRRDGVAEHDVEDAVRRAGGRHRTGELERAAEGEPADLEAVVRRRADHDRVGQDAEREHHEPSGDPADDEARQGTGGRPDEHGGRDVAGVVPDGDAAVRRLWRDRGHRCRALASRELGDELAVSVGVVPTRMPRASSACFFASAVPDEPEMIAPAWPMVLPGGAVKPAM